MSVRFSAADCPVKESMSIVGAIHESPVKSEPPNGEAHFVGANCVRLRTASPGCPYGAQNNAPIV